MTSTGAEGRVAPAGLSRNARVEVVGRRRIWLGFLRMLPDFIVIGAQKGGTTSLYEYLRKDPGFRRAKRKEINFFDQNYARGANWYRAHFPTLASRMFANLAGRRFVTGEMSVSYILDPRVPARVRALVPDVKIIALLRDPIARAYSHYQHEVRHGRESLPFEEAIDREHERTAGELEKLLADPSYQSYAYTNFSYLLRGRYAEQLGRWLAVFPRGQILVLKSEDFYADTPAALARIAEFVGMRSAGPDARLETFEKHNAGKYQALDPALRARLAGYFAPHNRRLSEMLGGEFDWAT